MGPRFTAEMIAAEGWVNGHWRTVAFLSIFANIILLIVAIFL